MNDKNYYMTETIGDSGVAETRVPTYLSEGYQPFEIAPRRRNIGDLFTTDSKYDEYLGDVQGAIQEGLTVDDLRARKQSGWAMAGNALLNNIVIAGTTAIGGTLGLVDGLLEAVSEADPSKIWDNDINNWVADAQEATREAFPIYRGNEYESKSLLGKMGTGVFWADLVQNFGYTEGMLIPGMGVSRLLASAPKMFSAVIPSLASAIGEAGTEAVNARNDEVDNKIRMANQRYNELVSNVQTPFALGVLDSEYKETLSNIEDDARNAGNFVFGSNVALLTMSNAIQFGSLFSRGFGTAKRLKGALRRKGNDYFTQGLGVTMTKEAGKKLLDATSEGLEEVTQSAISSTPSNFEDFNTFNESMFNPEKRELVANLWSAFGKTYSETMKDPQTAVDFASGFLIGAFGVPVLRKSKFPIGLENNIGLELRDAYKDWQKRQRQADEINSRLAEDDKINSYYNGLVRHLSLQDRMNGALDREDAFDYKNAESAQFISDIMMFDDAGDIDNLKNIINNSIDMSDEGIDNLIDETSKDGEGPFMQNGNRMSRDQVREILQEKIQVLNSKIDAYTEDKEALERNFPDMSEDTMKNAMFLKQQMRDYQDRLNTVSDEAWSGVRQLVQADKAKPKPKKKINKGEGTYVTMPDGSRKLVRKDAIEYYEADGTPVFKESPEVNTDISKEDFINSWLTSSDFRRKVTDLVNDNTSTIPYDKRKEIANSLKDTSRLASILPVYINNLSDVLSNPDKASELTAKNIEKAQEDYKRNTIADIKDSLLEATSVKDVQGILSNLDDNQVPYIEDALNEISNGENEELKDIVKNYKDLSDYESSLSNIIEKIPSEEADLKTSMANIIYDAFKEANSKEEVDAILNDAVTKLPSDLGKSLSRIMEKAKNNSSSKKAAKERDSNKPEKKIKKKKGFSLSDAPDVEIPDAGTPDDNEGYSGRRARRSAEEPERPQVEKELKDKSVTELEEIAKGKVPRDTPKEDIPKVKKLASTIAENRRLPNADEQAEGTNSEDNNPKDNRDNEPYLRSWYHTKYRFDELKNRDIRRAERYNSPVVDALDELGAYDFVDEGKLGILFNANPNIPIHYVKVKNDRLKNVVVLAIEVTPEVQRMTNPTTAFEAQDGKRYQAVGALGFDSKNAEAVKGFQRVISNFNDELEDYLSNNSEPQFYVAQNQTNKIKHIYSGRMVKTTNEDSPRQKSLSDVTGNRPVLGIYYGNRLRVPMLDENQEIVPLNSNNTNPKDGSVWLMSMEADGRWYAKAIKVKRFTPEEYDIIEHYNTPMMRRIIEDLRDIVDPEKDDYDRSIAKYDLMNTLYFPEGTEILFHGDNVSIVGLEDSIGKGLNIEEKVQAMLNALQDETLNLRFQVDPSQLSEEIYLKDLLDSDILTTDLAMEHNVNASFDLFITDAEGTPQGEAKRPKGHTGRKGVNNTVASRTLTLNGIQYSITDNNVVDNNGNVITDPYTIEELSLLQKIEDGSINPVEGNNRLYLGVHAMTGQQFGISGGHTITGDKLDKMLRAAEKKANKAERKVETNAIFEKVSKANLAKLAGLDEKEVETTPKSKRAFSISNLPDTPQASRPEEEEVDSYEELIEGKPSSSESEKAKERPSPKKEMPAVQESKSPVSLFGSPSESNLNKLKALEDTEVPEATKKPRIISDTFVKGNTPTLKELNEKKGNPDFFRLAKSNRKALVELGFKNVSELEALINDPSYNLPAIETINTQDKFATVLALIRDCRKFGNKWGF